MTNSIPQQKTVIEPSLSDALLNLKVDIFASLFCSMPGIIQSFNPDACTAVVQPVFKRKLPNGNVVTRQVLADCPVWFPSGGGGRLTFPVAAGDQCIILFQDRRIDEWFQSGATSLPADVRMHDISDGIVLVGLDPTASFGPVPTNVVELSYLGTKFQLSSSGWNFIGSGGAEIDLTGEIVTIKNTTTTLLTLIDALIAAIEAIQVTGPLPLTAPSIAALEAVKTEMATLLG